MDRFLTYLFIIYFFSTCAVLYAVNCIICLLTAPFDKLRRAVHTFSCYWGYHYFQINPLWKLHYEGVEQIRRDKHYVLISNHQSLADILCVYGMHRHFKWVSKQSIAKVPFVGWNMLLNQYVLLKRGDLKSIKQMMSDCRGWLKKGSSIVLFPEGTRSLDGRLQPFRDGAFKLSLDEGVELVPIVIDGTLDLLPKGSTCLRFKQKINIKVLPPVRPQDFAGRPGKMRAHVHELMAQTLAGMRGVPIADVLPLGKETDQTVKERGAEAPRIVASGSP